MTSAAALPATPSDARNTADDAGQHLRRVFTECSDGLYRYILVRVGGNRDAADDLIQQCCCIAITDPARVPTDAQGCEAWLIGIARNLVKKYWRQAGRSNGHLRIEDVEASRRLADDMESRPLPPDAAAGKERSELLLRAVTLLSAADQELIIAFYFEGQSHAQIAGVSGTTVKSIESRLYRARQQLRRHLRNPE